MPSWDFLLLTVASRPSWLACLISLSQAFEATDSPNCINYIGQSVITCTRPQTDRQSQLWLDTSLFHKTTLVLQKGTSPDHLLHASSSLSLGMRAPVEQA